MTAGGSSEDARPALLLCAHGRGGAASDDHIPERLADTLRGSGRFVQVECCYLRGTPDIATALGRMDRESIVLVPLLLAEGHTSRVVLPAALAEAGERAGRVRVTAPLGVSPGLPPIAARAALAECEARGWAPDETAILVVGHGTPRHPESGASAERLAARIAKAGHFREAAVAFIEQEPKLKARLADYRSGPCVLVGLFMDHGGHSAEDIPAAIAAVHPEAAYTGAIGAHPDIAEIVLALAEGAVEQ
jgi:sirohydrochlorin cobaltochelatase